jgi:hypothetical protein
VKTIWQVRRAAFARALCAIAVSATRTPQNNHTTHPPRTFHWRSIGTAALLAGAFLLPAFAAQAQVATTNTLTSSENPSHVSDPVTFTATVSSNGGAAPTGSVQFIDFKTFNEVTVPLTPGTGDTSTATTTFATIDPGTLQTGTHGMQANYQPTGNFASSTGSVLQQVIADGVTGTTTTLISSQNPCASGQSVTFTATVSATSGTTAPTGTVSFLVDGTTASTPTLQTVGGLQQATFTTSSLTAATHNISAIYNLNGGNASFAQSSANLTQTVTSGTPTTIAVASSVNPSTANQSVTLTATVSVASGFTGSPTGSVDFKDITTNTDLGTATLQSVGGAQQASVTASFVQVETHNIQVTYTPNTMTFASDVVDFSQIVTSGTATTASIQSSQNPSFVGNPVTFTVMIKPTSGTGTPTGNVTIQDAAPGGFSVVATLNNGQATFTTNNSNNLVAGTNNITVTYAGDGTFAASTASLTQTVNTPTATTTAVASSANPSLVNQSVTFTATVSPNTATGSVIFTIDGTAGAPIKLSGGMASTSTSALTVAGSPHSVSAAFTSTDGSFGASTGSLNPGQTVNKNTSTTMVTSGQNPTATGNTVTFTATVSGGGGGVTPGGMVQFSDNGTNVGAPVTLVNGVAKLPITFATAVTHTITATYGGDTNFNGSNGSFMETVNAGSATTTMIASSQNPSVVGQAVTFTATVSGGGGTPTGSVTFTIDGIAGFTVNLINGVATTPPQTGLNVPGSPHTITAAYSGDATFTGSTAANFSQNVNAANTTTTVVSSGSPSAQGQSVTFTATVTTNSPGSGTPTGSVVFTIDGTAGAAITLSGGMAQTSTSTLTVAGSPHSVFATFTSATTNFNGSTSATIQQNVVGGSSTTALKSSANPSTPGQSVTFTATITGTGSAATPTGTVTFKDNGTAIGNPVTVSTAGGVTTAAATETITTTGAHTITAVYSGDGTFAASNASLTQNVNLGQTKTTLTASPNPATPGQQVTFTATVTITSGTGTLSGTVTFKDGSATLGTGTLNGAGVATFTTTTPLTPGSHNITAVFNGSTSFATSTSAALVETVNSPTTDSTKLREMQISTTPVIAQAWGQTTAAAMDDAVSAGFGGNPQSLSPAGTGFTYYFNDDAPTQRSADSDQDSLRRYLASPNGSLASPNGNSSSLDPKSAAANDSTKRVDDDFLAMGYAGRMATKAPPAPSSTPHDWLAWVTVRGTDYFRGTFGNDLKGDQVDVLAGLTRRVSNDFVIGAFGGYEHFDYSSQALTGRLKGDGWTAGAYLGWKLAPNLRFDAGGAWADIFFANDTAGTANGNFTGTRWLVNGGLTGTYPWQMLVLEPSARVFAIWEHENAFTDSLGTFQPARNFETGRASVGAKAIYPFAWTSSAVALSPYAGLYADYYFSKDDAQTVGLTTVPLLQGFSARATGGVAASFAGGATLGAGGEFGGIGSATHIWTWTARGRIPF